MDLLVISTLTNGYHMIQRSLVAGSVSHYVSVINKVTFRYMCVNCVQMKRPSHIIINDIIMMSECLLFVKKIQKMPGCAKLG